MRHAHDGPKRGRSTERGSVPRPRRLSRRGVAAGGIALSLVLAVVSAATERGLRRVHRYSVEVARIEALNSELDAENRRLAREIEALRNDPSAAEAVARDELGLVRPGEKVFRFEGPER